MYAYFSMLTLLNAFDNFANLVNYAVTTQNLCPLLHRVISSAVYFEKSEIHISVYTCKIESDRKENNSVLHLMKAKCLVRLVPIQ